MGREVEQLVALVQGRALNLYTTRQLRCSEAVLVTLNRGLGGGLTDDMAIRLASALPDGLGGSHCLCGAASGGALALGLFLGRRRPGASDRLKAMAAAKELIRRIQLEFGSSCCSVLKKKGKKWCEALTERAAGLTAGLILEKRPELAKQADGDFLRKRDRSVFSTLKWGADLIRCQLP